MKKIFIVLLFVMAISSNSFAAGTYDGIWSVPILGYATINERDGQIIAVLLSTQTQEWEAFIGPVTGNQLTLSTLVSTVNSTVNVTFTSGSTATLTQISCSPQAECTLPNGTQLQLTKVW